VRRIRMEFGVCWPLLYIDAKFTLIVALIQSAGHLRKCPLNGKSVGSNEHAPLLKCNLFRSKIYPHDIIHEAGMSEPCEMRLCGYQMPVLERPDATPC
jgi:hypothetical protein